MKLVGIFNRVQALCIILPCYEIMDPFPEWDCEYVLRVVRPESLPDQPFIPVSGRRVYQIAHSLQEMCASRYDNTPRPGSWNLRVHPDINIHTISNSSNIALLEQLKSMEQTPPSIGNAIFWGCLQDMRVGKVFCFQ